MMRVLAHQVVSEVGYGVKWLQAILMHCTLIIEVILGRKTCSNIAVTAARVRRPSIRPKVCLLVLRSEPGFWAQKGWPALRLLKTLT
jgi:hypothetical protein